MASLEEIVGSYTPLTRTGNQWAGPCVFESHEGQLEVIGSRWRCSCGRHDQGDDALGFLRAVGEPDPEGALSNGRVWTPTLLRPTPPPPKWGLHRIKGDERTVLITDHRAHAKAADALLSRYCVIAWPDGGDKWSGLEPLRGRTVLLWPAIEGMADMERLEAVLVDALSCTGKILTTGTNLAEWQGTADELLTWARANVRALRDPAPEVAASDLRTGKAAPASQEVNVPEGGTPPSIAPSPPPVLDPTQGASESRQSDAEPPPLSDTDWPPGTQPKPRKRRFRVVGGGDYDEPDPEAAPLPQPMSEDALSDVFAEKRCEDWRYCREWDRWFFYDGDGWRPDKTELIDRLAVELCRSAQYWPEASALTPDGRRRIGQRRTAGQVRDMARSDRRIAATAEQWDTDPMMLGCPGGAIDLRTGKIIEGDREAYITMRTAVAPEAGEPTLWLSHLDKALQGDADTIGFLRRYLGYMLTGQVGEHCLVFFYGTGRNGKGTIVETVIKLLGDYGYAAPMNLLMESKSERHPTELASLRGRRAVSASEPPEGARWDDGRIRFLTGGDTINARGMRQDPFTFQPTHKLLLMGNHMPSLRSVDPAITARFKLIEFAYFFTPEERDPNFPEKLRAEWPRILNWMLAGCMEWQDAGLGLPEKIEMATSSYLQGEDEFAEWIDDCCEVSPQYTVKASDAYQAFRTWAEKRGSYVPSQKSFSGKLKDRGFSSTRTSNARMYKGFNLKLGATL